MNKEMKKMLERGMETARNLPPPKDELKRRTYILGKSKRIFYIPTSCTDEIPF